MTPLATYLANQLIARPKHREHIWVEQDNIDHLRGALYDIHCFELTECLPLYGELSQTLKEQGEERAEEVYSMLSFLPAPKTWMEWRHPSGNRLGFLLEQLDPDKVWSPGSTCADRRW